MRRILLLLALSSACSLISDPDRFERPVEPTADGGPAEDAPTPDTSTPDTGMDPDTSDPCARCEEGEVCIDSACETPCETDEQCDAATERCLDGRCMVCDADRDGYLAEGCGGERPPDCDDTDADTRPGYAECGTVMACDLGGGSTGVPALAGALEASMQFSSAIGQLPGGVAPLGVAGATGRREWHVVYTEQEDGMLRSRSVPIEIGTMPAGALVRGGELRMSDTIMATSDLAIHHGARFQAALSDLGRIQLVELEGGVWRHERLEDGRSPRGITLGDTRFFWTQGEALYGATLGGAADSVVAGRMLGEPGGARGFGAVTTTTGLFLWNPPSVSDTIPPPPPGNFVGRPRLVGAGADVLGVVRAQVAGVTELFAVHANACLADPCLPVKLGGTMGAGVFDIAIVADRLVVAADLGGQVVLKAYDVAPIRGLGARPPVPPLDTAGRQLFRDQPFGGEFTAILGVEMDVVDGPQPEVTVATAASAPSGPVAGYVAQLRGCGIP